ncbi:hypothetical protein CHS0354_001062 [Potamilus streckersoni]|uniref:Uncharacterized protein n=1 Tax=Potamilus streckersoni TaxID=2493646 RepID=A0AAE0SUN4_9BIVA|nr:hypothetical protein CHS0354_001062 [Potamilus streckersoni]
MTVKQGVFYLIVGLLSCIWSESAGLETVWLKEATSRLKIDKRTLIDNIDLPDELTFHLRRASNGITLHLKRNRDIDPNADVYFIRTLKDGQSVMVKTQNLENEDIAYYQDMNKGAVMTVRCDTRSSGQCGRVIYGNVRIGHKNYDLRPAETDVTSRFLGKRYILQEEENIRGDNSTTHKDIIPESKKKAEEGLKALLRQFDGKHKLNNVYSAGDTLSSRKETAFYKGWKTGRNSYSEQTKLMVNMRYKTIDDPDLSISIKLRDFIFFQV